MSSMQERVITVIAEVANVDAMAIRPESTLESLGLDSMDKIEILMALEEEFSCFFEDRAEEDVETVRGFVDLVKGATANV